MNWKSTLVALEEYQKQHPEDTKLPQVIKAWIESVHPGIEILRHPGITHLELVIEFRDSRLLWMKPEIIVKIC